MPHTHVIGQHDAVYRVLRSWEPSGRALRERTEANEKPGFCEKPGFWGYSLGRVGCLSVLDWGGWRLRDV